MKTNEVVGVTVGIVAVIGAIKLFANWRDRSKSDLLGLTAHRRRPRRDCGKEIYRGRPVNEFGCWCGTTQSYWASPCPNS